MVKKMDAKIHTLTVKAFRSIGQSITFDLKSPLTLIYAPNGTGKTTVCEAAEWLLTGQVERLSSHRGFDSSMLTSKFISPLQSPQVEASLVLSADVGYLSRKAAGKAEILEIGPSSSSNMEISHKDWLDLLSSGFEAGSDDLLASEQTIRRWVRGSRFLTTDDLASIMDADDFNAEKRIQVLSDLLGVRHLFDASKAIDDYVVKLNVEIDAFKLEIKNLNSERNNLRELEKNLVESPVIYWAGFDAQIGVIEEKIYGYVTQSPISSSRLEMLGSTISNLERENKNKLIIASKIDSCLVGQASDFYESQTLKIRLHSLSKKIASARGLIVKREGRISELQSEIVLCDERLKLFPGMRSLVESTAKELSFALEEHAEVLRLSKGLGLRKLRNLLSKKSISADVMNDSSYLKVLNVVSRDIPRVREEIKKLNIEKKKLVGKLALSQDEEVSYKSNLKICEDVLFINTGELQAIEQPLLTLQSGVRDYLSSHHHQNTSECPVCGYGYGSSDNLFSAMNKVVDALPALIESKRGQCQRISAERDFWSGKLDVIDDLRLRLEALDLDLAKANNHEKALVSGLSLYGISSRDPKTSMDREIAREALATKVFELYSSITALEQAFPDFGKISSLTVDELTHTAKLSEYQRGQEEIAKTLRGEVLQEKHHLNSVRSQVEIDSFNVRDIEIKLARANRKINDIHELWRSLVGDEVWSQSAFTKMHKALLSKDHELMLLRQSLGELGRQFSSSQALHRRDEIDESILEVAEKLFLLEGNYDLALKAKVDFNSECDRVTTERLENLAGSVTPLFFRMHSNRVYDSIDFKGGDQGGLLKIASGDDVFSTLTDLSQGQRQDLALAIFLARARSVGGTFFLDEPVVHLDDLNRVALLDILRAFAIENGSRINLVVTTSSKILTRHMIQKFSSVGKIQSQEGTVNPLTVYALEGNALTGVVSKRIY